MAVGPDFLSSISGLGGGVGGGQGRSSWPSSHKYPYKEQSIKRHYPDQPLVGVGAVVFKDGEVLLVRRGQEPALGSWSLPGGLVELGESLADAIRRGAGSGDRGPTVTLLGITVVAERLFPDPDGRMAYHYTLYAYICDYLGGDLSPGSDITVARSWPWAHLPASTCQSSPGTSTAGPGSKSGRGSWLPLTGELRG